MLRVSKRLTAKVFHGPEIEAGTSAADAAHIEAARLLQRQNDLSNQASVERSVDYRQLGGVDLRRDQGCD
jgi:hypothetical protein